MLRVSLLSLLAACSTPAATDEADTDAVDTDPSDAPVLPDGPVPARRNGLSWTEGGAYTVDWSFDPFPATVGAASVGLVVRGPDGEIPAASVTVTPWMPAHGHGVSEAPVVVDEGDASFQVSWEYSMGGDWELTLALEGDEGEDQLVIAVDVGR